MERLWKLNMKDAEISAILGTRSPGGVMHYRQRYLEPGIEYKAAPDKDMLDPTERPREAMELAEREYCADLAREHPERNGRVPNRGGEGRFTHFSRPASGSLIGSPASTCAES